MNYFKKVLFIFSADFKNRVPFLFFLLTISLFIETLGLGILIPYFTILLGSDVGETYPIIVPLLNLIGNPDQKTLTIYGIFAIVIFFFFKSCFQLFANWRLIKFVTDLTADLKNRLFIIYLHSPYRFHTNKNSSDLSKNIQLEITQFIIFIQSILQLFLELTVISAALIVAAAIEPLGVLVSTIIIGLFIIVLGKILKHRILELGSKRLVADAETNRIILESLNAIKEIKISGKEFFFSNYLNSRTFQKAKLTSIYNFFNMIPRSFIEFIAVFSLACIIYISISLGTESEKILLIMGVFAVAAFKLIPSANKINTYRNQIFFNISSVDVIFEEFKNNQYKKPINNSSKMLFKSHIKIDKVFFKYSADGLNILNKISIKVKRGSIVGIIGESGSGKSTLIDLILGLYTPNKGRILVDDKNIHDNIRSWQNTIGYVPQTINLIDDTLKNNIVLGVENIEIDNEKLEKAIELSLLKNFINNLKNGLNSQVGEKGVRLSGGQRQRIGIARALYNNPEVLVLDEATSSLDTKTESEVMKSIDGLIGMKTILLVSHRLSTLKNCNVVYKIKDGLISKTTI
jgi:ATP-binding cassette, subfamily B, bacterial PglK